MNKSSILNALHETEECLGIYFIPAITLGPGTINRLLIRRRFYHFRLALTLISVKIAQPTQGVSYTTGFSSPQTRSPSSLWIEHA